LEGEESELDLDSESRNYKQHNKELLSKIEKLNMAPEYEVNGDDKFDSIINDMATIKFCTEKIHLRN